MRVKMAGVHIARRRNEPTGCDDPERVTGAVPVRLVRTPAAIVGLQRAAGNAAVARWLAQSFVGQGLDQRPTAVPGFFF